MKSPALRPLICLAAAIGLLTITWPGRAEDWFVKGRTYNNVHVIEVNPDTVSVSYDGGTGRLALSDLPPEIAQRFAADAKRAQAFAELEKKAETDAIDRLIVRLERPRDGMWVNGMWSTLALPQTAKPAELIAGLKYLQCEKIDESRAIEIDGEPFTAIRIEAAGGEKIVLLRYTNTSRGGEWAAREYPAGF